MNLVNGAFFALSVPDLGTSGAIVLVVLLFVVWGFVKGMVRMTFALVALTAGILAGLWGFQKGSSIAGIVISEPDPWMSGAVGVILGLAIFFVARALFGVLLSPVSVKDGHKKNLALPGGLLGLLMGLGFAWFLLSGIRYLGTLSELAWIKAAVAEKGKIAQISQPLLSTVKRAIDSSQPGQIHEKYDFLNDRPCANLAKLVVLVEAENPDAITKAAMSKEVRQAVYHDMINPMLLSESANLRSFIHGNQFSHLLQSDPIKKICRDEDVSAGLAELDLEKALGLVKEPEKKEDDKEKKKKS